MRLRSFRRCGVCGAPGHTDQRCAVFDLNESQERQLKRRRDNISLGLTPELEAQIARIRAAWRVGLATALLVLLCTLSVVAGTISGQVQTPTGGVLKNGTLGFKLSQPAVLSGTAIISTAQSYCYTSSVGNIVGLPDPLVLPIVSSNTSSGALTSGTYYTVITYYGAGGETVASPETSTVLSATGTLIITAPVLQPPSATGYKVYIGATSGSETLQATVVGFTQYQQTSALAAGTALPASNTTVCSVAFSDTLIPTGTYYSVSLVNKNGSVIAGFPQTWCTFGGAAGTINVSNGAPTGNCGSNGVFYPTPIFANPQNNAPQSISGPLALPGGVSGITSFFNGILSQYFSSLFTNPAASGVVRLAATDTACWRNQTNSADVCLSKNAADQVTASAFVAQNLAGIRFADQYAGADCGAKIDAADADLGATPGEIWINQNCGMTLVTPVNISAKHTVRFVQGGVWSQTALITLADGATMVGSPSGYDEDVLTLQDPAVTLRQPASTNLALLFSIAGQNVTLESFAIDGNARAGGNGSSVCIDFNNSNPAMGSRGRFHMYRMTVENCASGNVKITSDVSGDNQAIGAVITDSAINRSLSGNGLTVSRTTDVRVYRTYVELNGGYGIELLDTVAQIINNDISTNNNGQVYSHVDSLAHTIPNMQGGSATIIGNGLSSSGATSGLVENTNSSIIINGYNGTDCNQNAGNIIQNNSVNYTAGMQANVVDAVRIIDSGSNKVTGNNILGGPVTSFKSGVSIAAVSCGSENSDTVSNNNFFNTFGTSPYSFATGTDSWGNTIGATPQEQRARTSSTCATAASVGATCTSTVTWPLAFLDTNYTAQCSGDVVTSGIPVDGGLTAKAAGSVTFKTTATTAAAAQFTNIDCTAIHD